MQLNIHRNGKYDQAEDTEKSGKKLCTLWLSPLLPQPPSPEDSTSDLQDENSCEGEQILFRRR